LHRKFRGTNRDARREVNREKRRTVKEKMEERGKDEEEENEVNRTRAYSFCWHSSAVPRRTQCCGGSVVGSVTAVTKFVECPVVDSTP
jgi:hypothetical protein